MVFLNTFWFGTPQGRTHRFSVPTFRLSGATIHWKNTVCCDFLPFRAHGYSFFWLSLLWYSLFFSSLLFASLPLPTYAFHLSSLSEVWLLHFLRLLILSFLILSYHIISVLSYLSNLIQSDLCNLIQSYLSNMIQSYLSNPFQFNLSNLIYVILSI